MNRARPLSAIFAWPLAIFVIGLAGTWFVGQAMQSLLYAVAPHDLRVIGGVSVLLTLVAIAATVIPARRAARVNPLTALTD